tara:strand:+ start:9392 stop:10873 length:1482 start_codon:yes stop_codon:yes gene_type:complete
MNNTIRGYLGGGLIPRMGYQSGGYIPGVSGAGFRMGLQRDASKAQEEFQKQAEKYKEEQEKRGLFGKIGSALGTAAGVALAPATGGLSLIAAKGIGSALGSGLGEMAAGKMYDTGKIGSSTGLYTKDFQELSKMETDMDKGTLGRALGAGAGTAWSAGLGDLVKMGAGSLFGKGRQLLGLQPDMAGKVVDASGNIVNIPQANVGIADDYFSQTLGFQDGGMLRMTMPEERLGNFSSSFFDSLETAEPSTSGVDISTPIMPPSNQKQVEQEVEPELVNTDSPSAIGPLTDEEPMEIPSGEQLANIENLQKDRQEMGLRRDYRNPMTVKSVTDKLFGKNRYTARHEAEGITKEKFDEALSNLPSELNSSQLRRQDALTKMLDKERIQRSMNERYNEGLISDMDILPDAPITPLFESQSPTEMAYQSSLPRAESIGLDNQLLSMAQDSLAQQRKMEGIASGLGDYINTGMQMGGKVGYYGKGKGLLSINPFIRRII